MKIRHRIRKHRALSLYGGVALACLTMSGTAWAQDQAAAAAEAEQTYEVDEIVVTGTSIRGAASVGSKAQVVSSEDIQAAGVSNTTDLLRTIPQFVNLGVSEGRGGSTQSAQGSITQGNAVNLRGLGAESTLVLLNGRRIQGGGSQARYYDLSLFPPVAISRIEVVADGASAIYGSDAVGGVINIITKKGFNGSETNLRYGAGDGFDEWRLAQSWGRDWGTGSLSLAYEHYERDDVPGSARSQLTQNLTSIGGPDLRSNYGSPGTIVVGGVTYAVPTGQNGVGLRPDQLVAGTQNRYDLHDRRSFLPTQKRDNFMVTLRQDVNDKLNVWYEGFYSRRDSVSDGVSINEGAATATLTVPNSNPFFVHPTNPAATSVAVNYNFGNDFDSVSRAFEWSHHNAVGLTYELPAEWTLDAHASHSQSKASRRIDGQVRTINMAAALADRNPLTAFNPFCDGYAFTCNNPQTLERLKGFSLIEAKLEQQNFRTQISGPLFNLPAGPVRAALGYEFTESSVVTTNGRNTATVNPAMRVTSASRDVSSVYGELLVPIFTGDNARPGFERLELSLAARYDEYSDFGGTTNPKVGLRWDPISDLTLRASYGTSFRAQTVSQVDIYSTLSYLGANVLDPTTGRTIRVLQLLGGREGVQPETATTWTLGGDYTPSYLPGLRLSATYYNVDFVDRISTLPIATILANEATLSQYVIRNPSEALVNSYMTSPYMASAVEPASNIVAIIDGRTTNLGGLKQVGLDLTANYDWETSFGSMTVGVMANLILEGEQSDFGGAPFVDILDRINYPVSKRGRANIGWRNGSWRADAFVNYVGEYKNDLFNAPAGQPVDAWATVDASIGYSFEDGTAPWNRGVRVTLSATNLLDQDPPEVVNIQSGVQGLFDSQNASAIGRLVAFEITKSW